jgi:hypothetical protein
MLDDTSGKFKFNIDMNNDNSLYLVLTNENSGGMHRSKLCLSQQEAQSHVQLLHIQNDIMRRERSRFYKDNLETIIYDFHIAEMM